MPRLKREPRSCNPLAMVIGLPLLFSTGCDRQDLSQYRPAGQQVKKPAAPDQASDSPRDPVNSTPATGTVASEVAISTVISAPGKADSPAPSVPSQSTDDVSASALVPVNVVDGGNVRSLLKVPSAEPPLQVSPNTLNPAVATGVPETASKDPRRIELLVKDKTFRTEQKFGALRASFDDLDLLKVLNMEPVVDNAVELMPAWLKGLDGKRICIRGFMYPTYDTEGIEQFVLARDNQICCFGRDPKIYDLIQVNMKSGKSTVYIPATRSFDVVGTFHIDAQREFGGLYLIDDAIVIDR